MTIRASDVYEVFALPAGLRTHMAGTVAVVELLTPHPSPAMAAIANEVSMAMALHDVGNLVKPIGDGSFLAEPADHLDRWTLAGAYAQARYGNDSQMATTKMLTELGVKTRLIELIERKSSRNLLAILDRNDPAELLAIYADMRVGPGGLTSIADRHAEAQARYAGANREGLGGAVTLADLEELESRVTGSLGLDPTRLVPELVLRELPTCLSLVLDDAFQ